MSKKLLAAAAVSSVITIGALVLASAWWEQSAWPSDTYIVHLKDSQKTAMQCEVMNTFLKGERILATFNPKEGHYAGCFLAVTGELQADGSLIVQPRPGNPLSVRQWLQWRQSTTWLREGVRVIKASDLDGVCHESGEEGIAGAKAPPACTRLKALMDSVLRSQGL